MYTSNIQFAPLSSWDIKKTIAEEEEFTERSTPISHSPRDLGVIDAPSLKNVVTEGCSPKSIYALANKVCSIFPCLRVVIDFSVD